MSDAHAVPPPALTAPRVPVGIVYAILAGLLYVVAFLRHRQTRRDFADKHLGRVWHHAMPTVGQAGKQNFGRPLTTAAWFVLLVTLIVALVEVAFLVLIFRMDLSDLAAEQGITKNGASRSSRGPRHGLLADRRDAGMMR